METENQTQQVIQSPPNTVATTPSPTSKRKLPVILVVVVLLLLVGIGVYYLGSSDNKSNHKLGTQQEESTSSAQKLPILITEDLNISDVLIDHVPNVDTLKIEDLPNVFPRSEVFQYRDKLLIVGAGIIEIDPATKEVLRQNDTSKYDCIQGSVLIGDDLYMYCPGNFTLDDDYEQKQGVYRLNLAKNSITKAYFDPFKISSKELDKRFEISKKSVDQPIFIGVDLGVVNEQLWIGTRNGIVKLNPQTDSMQFYNAGELGQNTKYTCPDVHMQSNNLLIWTYDYQACGQYISIYNQDLNNWTEYAELPAKRFRIAYSSSELYGISRDSERKDTLVYTFNQKEKKWVYKELQVQKDPDDSLYVSFIPNAVYDTTSNYRDLFYFDKEGKLQKVDFKSNFVGVSNKRNNKYYLIASDGLYSVQQDSFPKKIFTYNFPYELTRSEKMSQVFADQKEEKLLFIGIDFGQNDNVTFYLMNLKTGDVKILFERKGYDETQKPTEIRDSLRDLVDAQPQEIESGVKFLRKYSDEVLLEVNLEMGQIKFTDR